VIKLGNKNHGSNKTVRYNRTSHIITHCIIQGTIKASTIVILSWILGNNESKGCIYCANSLSYFFYCTNSIFLRLVCTQKSTMTCLLINNNSSITKFSTIICDAMWRRYITMSLVDLLHELDVFTTRVKTKTVSAMGYSTSIILVHYKLLRCNLIPCQQLLLIFDFLFWIHDCFYYLK